MSCLFLGDHMRDEKTLDLGKAISLYFNGKVELWWCGDDGTMKFPKMLLSHKFSKTFSQHIPPDWIIWFIKL